MTILRKTTKVTQSGSQPQGQSAAAEPNWSAMTPEELIAYRAAENRRRSSPDAQAITGAPDPAAEVEWQQLRLADRTLPVRVYRPSGLGTRRTALPLVLHVHGGGFVGTAAQSDWVNSHLAVHLPAVMVSVEHRLLDADTALSAAVDDGWDTLRHVGQNAAQWGIDPKRTAVLGESCGGLIAALAAIRADVDGMDLRAQVLVNPVVDVTETMFDHDSITEHAQSRTLNVAQLRLFRSLAVPSGTDPYALSPLYAHNLNRLAQALVVVPTHDPLADHGRRYAERLQGAGTPAQLAEYPQAPHAFLSTPGVVPQAEAARDDICEFLRRSLLH